MVSTSGLSRTTGCGNPDPRVCQVNVSAAFYLSIEFQETGYLAYRMFKAAFGDSTLAGRPRHGARYPPSRVSA